MQLLLRLIGSFLIACLVLSGVSFLIAHYQILPLPKQLELKTGKTYWEWQLPETSQTPTQIHYIEKGEGPHHVVLIHGFRANTYTWKHLLDPLAEAGFHVWALDLIGYGFSDKPTISYDLDLFVNQIATFIKDKEIHQAHFIGASMGGGIILSLGVQQPESVKSLTLISALGYPLDMPLYISIGKHLSQLWAPFLGPRMIRKGIEQLVYQKDLVSEEQIHAYFLPYCFPGGAAAALSTLKNFDNQKLIDLSQQYQSIKCPTCVIWGDHDSLIPLQHYGYFCKAFPHGHHLLIKECGHIPQEEKPEEVKNAILAFLKQFQDELQ